VGKTLSLRGAPLIVAGRDRMEQVRDLLGPEDKQEPHRSDDSVAYRYDRDPYTFIVTTGGQDRSVSQIDWIGDIKPSLK
jgi:hypothetical protein